MIDKYGVGQDPYCYPGTSILRNKLNIRCETELDLAERELSDIAASQIELCLPPYDFAYLKEIHSRLFQDLYDWAGEIRHVDISKDTTRFCRADRIVPESKKLLAPATLAQWAEGLPLPAFINACAEAFGDLNMVHPFREGNGRTQRIFFEHLIVNAGYEINWWEVDSVEWRQANIAAVHCDYSGLATIFSRCIGPPLPVAQ